MTRCSSHRRSSWQRCSAPYRTTVMTWTASRSRTGFWPRAPGTKPCACIPARTSASCASLLCARTRTAFTAAAWVAADATWRPAPRTRALSSGARARAQPWPRWSTRRALPFESARSPLTRALCCPARATGLWRSGTWRQRRCKGQFHLCLKNIYIINVKT